MLSRLFSKSRTSRGRSGPPGSRAYAIGDVHGRLDLLVDLLARIEEDNARRGPAKTWLVFLGDLVDRGPDSRGVVDLLVNRPPAFARNVFLKGNHEEFFLGVLGGDDQRRPALAGLWRHRMRPELRPHQRLDAERHPGRDHGAADPARCRRAMSASSTRCTTASASATICSSMPESAPASPSTSRSAATCRWIREGFLEDRSDHGVVVVHGHTIVERPEEHPNRIALDTGAYRSGTLTAIGLEGEERWFLEARETDAAAAA